MCPVADGPMREIVKCNEKALALGLFSFGEWASTQPADKTSLICVVISVEKHENCDHCR